MSTDHVSKPDTGPGPRLLYSAGPPWMLDFAIPIVLGLATLGIASLNLLDVTNSGPLFFDAVLLAVLVLSDYWFLWRVAYRLEFANDLLTCRSRFASWTFPLSQLVRLRPAALDVGFQVVDTRSDPRHLLVCVSKGFGPFARALQRERPDLEIGIGWVSRLLERMPWPSSFREL